MATTAKLDKLRTQRANANRHTPRGMKALEESIQKDGWIGAVTVAADGETFDGSARLEVSAATGFEDVIIVDTDGTRPVVLRRTDIPTATDPRAVRLGLAANRVSQLNLDWDTDVLAQLSESDNQAFDGLWSDREITALLDSIAEPVAGEEDGTPERKDLPEALYPSENEWGIPLLDIRKQASAVELPVIKWGVLGRTELMRGTYHFYTDDYKFAALWYDPTIVLRSKCKVVIEPNYSTVDNMPRAIALFRTFQKRWMSRYWQEQGIKVIVDLNVTTGTRDINLLGVPKGWRSYATRAITHELHMVEEDYNTAVEHAGTDDILFVVVGGYEPVKRLCQECGWVHIQEGQNIGNKHNQQEEVQDNG